MDHGLNEAPQKPPNKAGASGSTTTKQLSLGCFCSLNRILLSWTVRVLLGAPRQLGIHLVEVRGLMNQIIPQDGSCLAGFLEKMNLLTGSLVEKQLLKTLLFYTFIAVQSTISKHRCLKQVIIFQGSLG